MGPHLHAPGTLLNDQFRGDWDASLADMIAAAAFAEDAGGGEASFLYRASPSGRRADDAWADGQANAASLSRRRSSDPPEYDLPLSRLERNLT